MKNFHRTDGEEKDGTNLYLRVDVLNVPRKCEHEIDTTKCRPQCLFLRSGNEGEMRLNETRVSWARNENGEHQSILRGGHSEQREEHFPRCAQGGNRAQNEHASPGYDGESTWKRWKIDWKSALNVWYSTYNNSFSFLNNFEFVWSLYPQWLLIQFPLLLHKQEKFCLS